MAELRDPPIHTGFVGDEASVKLYEALKDEWRQQLTDYVRNHYWEVIYPVGSVFTSTDNTNPGSFFGGTWAVVSAISPYSWERTE